MANATMLIRLREALTSHTSSFGSAAPFISSSSLSIFSISKRSMGTLNGGQVPYSKRVIRSRRK